QAFSPTRELLPVGSQPATQPFETWLPALEGDPANAPDGSVWINRAEHEVRVRLGDKIYMVAPLREVTGGNRIVPTIRIADFVVLILQMAAAFGIGFQVPVVVALLATIGVVSTSRMAQLRRQVWFGIAVLAAIVTPTPDAAS